MSPSDVLALLALFLTVFGIFYTGSQTKPARKSADAAKGQVDAAREQVRAVDAQVAVMQRQTAATVASLELQLERVVVKTPRALNEDDQRLATRKCTRGSGG